MHSLVPKMDYQCFYQDPYENALGEMKTVGEGRKSRPKAKSGVEFLGKGQQASPARGLGSTVSSAAGFGRSPDRLKIFKNYFQH